MGETPNIAALEKAMTDKLTPERLAEIRTRAEAATPGPWWEEGDREHAHKSCGLICRVMGKGIWGPPTEWQGGEDCPDRRFIATMNPETTLALLAHIEALEADLQAERERAEELQALFNLQHNRTAKADKLWQEATGQHGTLPDLGNLIDWLLARAEKAEEALALAGRALEEALSCLRFSCRGTSAESGRKIDSATREVIAVLAHPLVRAVVEKK